MHTFVSQSLAKCLPFITITAKMNNFVTGQFYMHKNRTLAINSYKWKLLIPGVCKMEIKIPSISLSHFESYFIWAFTYKNHIFLKKKKLNNQLALFLLLLFACWFFKANALGTRERGSVMETHL